MIDLQQCEKEMNKKKKQIKQSNDDLITNILKR